MPLNRRAVLAMTGAFATGAGLTLKGARAGAQAVATTRTPIGPDDLFLAEGDSIASPSGTLEGQSMAAWFSIAAGGRARFAAKSRPPAGTVGSSGGKLQDVAARIDGNLQAWPDLKYLLLHIGTNDLYNLRETHADRLPRLQAIVDRYNAAGVFCFVNTVLPRAIRKGYTAVMETERQAYNAGLARILAGRQALIIDHDGDFDPASMTYNPVTEGLHPSPRGMQRIAQRMVQTILTRFELTAQPDALFADSLIRNSGFEGEGGAANGLSPDSRVPDEWIAANASGAEVRSSIVIDGEGTRCVQFDVSGSATSGTGLIRLYQSLPVTPGADGMDAVGVLDITGPGGQGAAAGLKGLQLICGDAYVLSTNHNSLAYGPIPNPAGLMRTLPMMPRSAEAVQIYSFRFTFNPGPVAARIRMSLPRARRLGGD